MASNSLLPIKFQNLIELLADRLLKIISDDSSLRNFGIYIRRNSNNRVLLVKKKKNFPHPSTCLCGSFSYAYVYKNKKYDLT